MDILEGVTTVVLGDRPVEIEAWLARRKELGQDRFDEVWEGDYHVVPAPSGRHADVDSQLGHLLRSRARAAGLFMSTAFNLGVLDDFRVPDGGVHRERPSDVFLDTAAVVVEVLSPRDETFEKFDFYARHGVEEVIVADPQSRNVRIWQLRGDSGYDETGRSDVLAVTAATLTDEIDWP